LVLRFSPDGLLLVAVAAGKGLRLWNLETREEVATLEKSEAAPCRISFATKSEFVAVGNVDGTVEVWNLLRKERVGHWKAHKEAVFGVAFMPDAKRLVTVSEDGSAALWELETQDQIRPFGRTLNAFDSVAVSPDGHRIAAGTWEQGIKIWNAATGQEVATLKGIDDWLDPNFPGRSDAVDSLVFLPPDGNTLISGTDHELRLWRAPSWAEIEAAEAKKKAEARQP
jgi:WD40 repeat protein